MLRQITMALAFTLMIPMTSFSQTNNQPTQAKNYWCNTSVSTCLVVKKGETWETVFPNERDRNIVMRVNHTNGRLYPGQLIKIPNNLAYGNLLDYSPLPRTITAPGEKLIIFDPVKHAWGAYDPSGQLVNWGPATGGASWCSDIGRSCKTKAGSFRIYSLGSAACKSTKFPVGKGGAPMPFCSFFNGGQAFHGSPGEVRSGNLSHGCVRLFVDDAKWLRYNFFEGPTTENHYRGTKVIVMPY